MDLSKASSSFGKIDCVGGSKLTINGETLKNDDDSTLHTEVGSFVNGGSFRGDNIHEKIVTRLRAAGCVFAEDESRLLISAARTPAELTAMVDRRTAGLPLEHVIGWTEFCGLRISVDPGVFVPRHRTEFLVRQAANIAQPGAVVVDLCCGTGAVGAALAVDLERIELYAADIDTAAVRCARRNVTAAGGQVYEGDLYEPLPATLRGRVDILVANAPYVPTEAIGLLPQEARIHEARVALTEERTGLTSIDFWRPQLHFGWYRAVTCWSRLASGRHRRPSRSSLATDSYRRSLVPTNWTPPSLSEPGLPYRAD